MSILLRNRITGITTSTELFGEDLSLFLREYPDLVKVGIGTTANQPYYILLNETIEECGKREVFEETGIIIKNKSNIENEYTNDIFIKEKKHYITLYQKYNVDELLIPKLIEPEKCFEWGWFDINNLPEPLFLCVKNYLIKYSL